MGCQPAAAVDLPPTWLHAPRLADASGSQAGTLAGRSGRAPARPGSIASTYWRDERSDRKNLLTVIDERWAGLLLVMQSPDEISGAVDSDFAAGSMGP